MSDDFDLKQLAEIGDPFADEAKAPIRPIDRSAALLARSPTRSRMWGLRAIALALALSYDAAWVVFHERRAREVVECLRRLLDHVPVERLEQYEMLLERGRDACSAQFVDEIEEHRISSWSSAIGVAAEIAQAPNLSRSRLLRHRSRWPSTA